MIVLLAVQAISFGHPGSPEGAYMKCMAPIVWASEGAGEKSYQPPASIFERIRLQCSKERKRVRDDIVGQIMHQDPDLSPPPTDEEAEMLLHSQTVRWVSDVAAKKPPAER